MQMSWFSNTFRSFRSFQYLWVFSSWNWDDPVLQLVERCRNHQLAESRLPQFFSCPVQLQGHEWDRFFLQAVSLTVLWLKTRVVWPTSPPATNPSCSMTEDHSDWLKFAASCMSDVQWEVAAIRPEAVLSHRSCPWGGHLIKMETTTLGEFRHPGSLPPGSLMLCPTERPKAMGKSYRNAIASGLHYQTISNHAFFSTGQGMLAFPWSFISKFQDFQDRQAYQLTPRQLLFVPSVCLKPNDPMSNNIVPNNPSSNINEGNVNIFLVGKQRSVGQV